MPICFELALVFCMREGLTWAFGGSSMMEAGLYVCLKKRRFIRPGILLAALNERLSLALPSYVQVSNSHTSEQCDHVTWIILPRLFFPQTDAILSQQHLDNNGRSFQLWCRSWPRSAPDGSKATKPGLSNAWYSSLLSPINILRLTLRDL